MHRTSTGIDCGNSGRCKYNMLLLGMLADITQECRFSRTGFSCQKNRLTGILNQIQCILKLSVVSVYAHNIIICKFVDVLICQYVVS